ncbi:MAG: FliH/SctL family protein [Myxococcales bacterium]|nr:FliH/SctL family protein [Polyangiaceae bacterium]MDW8250737.1 FliH/SctL family protein [Myxococcales bacterium]
MGLRKGRIQWAEEAEALREPPRPRRILRAPEWVASLEEAHAIEEKARASAQAMLQEARAEAEKIRQEARRQGQLAAEQELAARWLALKQAEERWLASREGDIFAVARLLAERLLMRELEVHPSAIVDLTRQALAPLRRARHLAFYVHPEDATPLRDGLSALSLNADRIEVHLDPTASRGSVRILTELGAVRAELAPQLDRLLAALRTG